MDKAMILVVDDTPFNIDVLTGILKEDYAVKVTLNGKKALKIVQANPNISLVILDIMMPEVDGYEVCKQLKSNPSTKHIPVIFVTAKSSVEDESKGLALGAVDYITKPIQPAIVKARVKTQIMLSNQQKHLEYLVQERTKSLQEAQLEIIKSLGRAAEYKDNETGAHVARMSEYSRILADEISENKPWVNALYLAAPMHDVGKIGIPDSILLKPGKLDDEQWQVMITHPKIGAKILGNNKSEVLSIAREIALSHHEKWDGSGYPLGLSGDDIPLSGRIVAVADVFDALTCKRPYKKAWSFEEAVDFVADNSGSHFDPQVCLAFNVCKEKISLIYNELYDVE